jgi:hypothetical protein
MLLKYLATKFSIIGCASYLRSIKICVINGESMIRLSHRITIAIAIMLLFAGSLCAQPITTKPKASVPMSTLPTSDIEKLNAAKQQIELLAAQLQTTQTYQSSLLDSVHWAVGGILSIVLFHLGFKLYTDSKKYEQDKELLKKDLESYVHLETIKLNETFNTKFEDADTKSEKRLKGALEAVNSRAINLGFRVFRLEFDQRFNAIESIDAPSLALTEAFKLLEYCATESLGHLPKITPLILNKIDQGGKLGSYEKIWAIGILDAIPKDYSILTKEIRNKFIEQDTFR